MKLVSYYDLPESEKMEQPNNGYGREEANYLAFKVNGEIVYRSDAMEPEDARFTRDLSWIRSDIAALIAEREAAEADARECRAERARYSDAMTERLADAEAERDELRERCIEWMPFSEAAETIDSILVWREDAGVFVAFYADEQECWFTSFGEDLTGDLPAFYAKMPKGPDNKRPALQKDGLSDDKR